MAEWLYEAGIGEARAALVEDGRILAARVERDDGLLRVGTVAAARLVELLPGRQGRVRIDDGREALIGALPPGVTQGATLMICITREAIPEPGRAKIAKAAAADPAATPVDGPDLLTRITASGMPVRHCQPHQDDALEAAGWSEVLAEAGGDDIAFPGGVLRMSPTPAMTLFDVDGQPPLDTLAVSAARAVTAAIRRHGIGGSIGVDFPTLSGKAERTAVAGAIDASLAQPFERTALNGFGFLQIVRPRSRPSLPEIIRADPVVSATLATLRLLERTPPSAPRNHRLAPAVKACLAAHPHWRAALDRRTGGALILED